MYGLTISRWGFADQEPHSRQRNSLLERILLYKLQVPGSESRKTWLSKNNRIPMKARSRVLLAAGLLTSHCQSSVEGVG